MTSRSNIGRASNRSSGAVWLILIDSQRQPITVLDSWFDSQNETKALQPHCVSMSLQHAINLFAIALLEHFEHFRCMRSIQQMGALLLCKAS